MILTAKKLKDMLLLNIDPFHLQLEASFIYSVIIVRYCCLKYGSQIMKLLFLESVFGGNTLPFTCSSSPTCIHFPLN